MFIEQPPEFVRKLYPGAIWRMDPNEKAVYLTFDDGPIPEVTPWVLELLDKHNIKATFFMVGQNVERYPEVFEMVKREGHTLGCHTMHHLQGTHVTTMRYMLDVARSSRLIGTTLFRPPHGWLRPRQALRIAKEYTVVMYDLVTRDYSRKLTAEQVLANVKRYARPGAIIVFHDSLKSLPRLTEALPKAIEWLIEEEYTFDTLQQFQHQSNVLSNAASDE